MPPPKDQGRKPTTAPTTSAEGDAMERMSLLKQARFGRDLLESVLPIVDLEAHRKNKSEETANHAFEHQLEMSLLTISSLLFFFLFFLGW